MPGRMRASHAYTLAWVILAANLMAMLVQYLSARIGVATGKDLPDGMLTGADREHAEVSMLALRLLQSALVHVNTLLL